MRTWPAPLAQASSPVPCNSCYITASAPVTDPRAPGPRMAKTILQGSNGEAEAQHGSGSASCHGYCVPAPELIPWGLRRLKRDRTAGGVVWNPAVGFVGTCDIVPGLAQHLLLKEVTSHLPVRASHTRLRRPRPGLRCQSLRDFS